MNLHICEEGCEISHFDNCPNCFGFGQVISKKTGERVPVTAAEAHGTTSVMDEVMPKDPGDFPRDYVPCDYCWSTVNGQPREAVK